MPLLDLPPSPRRRVFRRIVQQVRNDPLLRRACRTILAWEGEPNSARELTQANSPGIRLTPSCGPDVWGSPEAFRGWLFVDVDLLLPGMDVGDMLDFWWAIERALYPADHVAAHAFQRDLRQLGALTGQVEFSQPAADEGPGDQTLQAKGQLKVEIRSCLNT